MRLLVAVLLAVLSVAIVTPTARADYATGGTGSYKGSIDWFTWGTNGAAIANGTTRTNTRTIGGQTVTTSCTINGLGGGSGGIKAYRPGTWAGDALDNLYNIGGANAANTLVDGIANVTAGQIVNFHVSCSATMDGNTIPLQGLVVADAEASNYFPNNPTANEYITVTPDTATTWRLLDRGKSAGCATDALGLLAGTALTLRPNGTECYASSSTGYGPMAVMFMEGSTAANVILKGGGNSAVALGVVLQSDFGDAPASYGAAGSIYDPGWVGGTLSQGTNNLTSTITPATPGEPPLHLGALIDSEGNYQPSVGANLDDTTGIDDEDSIPMPSPLVAYPGLTYSQPNVVCAGNGYVTGWVDWNGDGTFDAGEASNTALCSGGSVSLTWTVPANVATSSSYLRLRMGSTAAASQQATGLAATPGEVEDYPISITKGAAAISLTKTANRTTLVQGQTITFTMVATNTGNVTLTNAHIDEVSFNGSGALSPLSCSPAQPTTLAVGATLTCTATYVVTQADVDAGQIKNVATADGTPPTGVAPPTKPTAQVGVPSIPAPAISLTKKAGTPSGNTAGSTIGYTFVVTNTGNVTLSAVKVTDPKVGTVSCPVTTLAPGASTTCTAAPYVLTQADVNAGKVDNTATATGTPPSGTPPTATDSTHTPITQSPSISLNKKAGTPSGNTAGSTIGYTFLVTNTGNVTLDTVKVADPKVGPVSCPVTTLAPGASTTCTATYSVTQFDVDSGHVPNTAIAYGNPPGGDPSTTTDDVRASDSTDTPLVAGPAISLTKKAGTPSGQTAGSTIAYTFTVTNTGNVTLTSVKVTDPKVGAVTCPVTTLAPGASTTCTAAPYVLTQADVNAGKVDNTATATGTPPSGTPPTATDSTHTPITQSPSISLDKQAGTPTGNTAGSTITYTFVVTNTGNVTLDPVKVTDPKVGPVTCPVTSLAPGASTTCTAPAYSLTQNDVDAGHVANTATAYGNPPGGDPTTTTDDVKSSDSTDTPLLAGPAISLDKQAGAPTGNTAGSTITYTFLVTNTGNVTLTTVKVTDPKVGAVTCPVTTLAPGASTTCTAAPYAVTQADVNAGTVDNTATATGTPPSGTPPTATDSTHTPITSAAAISLDKKAGAPTGNTVGSTTTYTFVVTNTGNVTLSTVGVTDPKVGTVTCPVTTLAPGASTTCTAAPYALTQADVDAGKVDNTATATGTPPSGPKVTDDDSTHTPITSAASISLTKKAGAPTGNTAGSTITYTFTVTNTGNVTLSTVGVTDPKVGTVTCPVTTLAPGASATCTAAPYALTQADVDAGKVDNTATATGTPPSGPKVTDDDSTHTPIASAPSISLTKKAGAPTGNTAGSTITYTFVVTNTGNVTLSTVGVTDPKVGTVTCPVTTLAPGASTTCTAAPYALTQADVDASKVDNTATATGTPPSGPNVTDDDSTHTPITSAPSISLDKKAGTPSGNHVGDTIVYTFTVTNTGNVTLNPVSVSDPKVGTVTCPVTALAPSASTTCTAAPYQLTQADVDASKVDNTATATGTPPTGVPVTDDDSTHTPITSAPGIGLQKRAGSPTGNTAGSTITYTFTVTNTGNVTLDPVAVTDPKVGTVTCPVTSLAPGKATTCTAAPYVLTQADVDAGKVDNTATATGTPPSGPNVTDDDSTHTPIDSAPGISLDKKAGTPTGNTAGSTITYTFTVTNTGNVTLDPVAVTDPKVGTVTCPVTSLAPGKATTCTADPYVLTQADVNAGKVDNTATATGTPPSGPNVTDDDSTHTPITASPSLTLDKQAGAPTGNTAGSTITYTFVVTNTGNVTLDPIAVTDPKVGTVTCPVTSLAPGKATTCTAAPYVLTQADVNAGKVDNTATATGTPPSGPKVTDDDSTHTPITQTPLISLDKQAAAPTGNDEGDTITYTFVVTNTGNVTLDPVSVNDPKVGAVTCPVTTLAPGASTTCTAAPYALTQADVDAGTVKNTATAFGNPPGGDPADPSDDVTAKDSTVTPIVEGPAITLDKVAGMPSGHSAGDTIAYTFTVTNVGNVTLTSVTVTDPKVGAVTCPVTTLAPRASTTCTAAAYTLTQADVDAGKVDNTATATGTPPSGTPPTATDSTHTPIPSAPAITLDKVAGAPSGNTAGSTISYTFTVTNTGNVTLDPVSVSDPKVGTVTCPVTSLAPGKNTTCTADPYVLTQADVDAGKVDNTATATGTPPTGGDVTATDGTHTPIISSPAITLDKKAGAPTGVRAGDTITYTFTVTNTGNVTLDPVSVNDPKVGTVTCPVTTLAPGASTTCTAAPYVLTQADVDAAKVDNTATASGTPPSGPDVTATDGTHTPLTPAPAMELVKKVAKTVDTNANGKTDQGDELWYAFDVTNTGNVSLDPITVTDAMLASAGITITCPAGPLAPGASSTCTADAGYVVTQADMDAGAVDNTATATGTPPTGPPAVTPPSTTTTPLDSVAALGLVKRIASIDDVNRDGLTNRGDRIWWVFDVTNIGNTTVADPRVSDPLLAGLKISVTCPAGTLVPGAKVTCMATTAYVITRADQKRGRVVNVATASAHPLICSGCSPVTTPPSSTLTGINTLTVTPIHHGGGGTSGGGGGSGGGLASTGGPSLYAGGLALLLIIGGAALIGLSRRTR